MRVECACPVMPLRFPVRWRITGGVYEDVPPLSAEGSILCKSCKLESHAAPCSPYL